MITQCYKIRTEIRNLEERIDPKGQYHHLPSEDRLMDYPKEALAEMKPLVRQMRSHVKKLDKLTAAYRGMK